MPLLEQSYLEYLSLRCYDKQLRQPVFGSDLCECGCGGTSPIATKTSRRDGSVRGMPRRYIHGHHAQSRGPYFQLENHGYSTPCWAWLLSRDSDGYARIQNRRATRIFYQYAFGVIIPNDLVPDHLCHYPPCVNPFHLEPVSTYENVHRGESCTVSEETALRIIALRKSGMIFKKIADEVTVSRRHVMAICYGEHWQGTIPKEQLPLKTSRPRAKVAQRY